ncbi:MAG: hypothetical protein IKA72_03360 [Clostridia bacterium]|nr:hypothetical protein [Clostridia bacterium]
MKKFFTFTMDDNIQFLEDLTTNCSESIFSHPYTKMLKEFHEIYGIKVQLNLFYENPSFNLSKFPETYKEEWQENSSWLKLSFHSKKESPKPYLNSDYQEVYDDCKQVHDEILRFAGEDSLAKTTTIHFTRLTEGGLVALKNCGVQGLIGQYGTEEKPRSSYQNSLEEDAILRTGEIVESNGISYINLDVILDRFTIPEILEQLSALKDRKTIKILIHEQQFYTHHVKYQPEYKDKLKTAFEFLKNNGYESVYFEELLNPSL